MKFSAEVLIAEAAMEDIEIEAEREYPLESGGVLLGHAAAGDEQLIQILAQTGPGPGAEHKPHRFLPDDEWQFEKIASAYEESGCVVTYLGEWHSHPGGTPTPSVLDRSTALKIARHRDARTAHPLTLILGGRPEEWQLVAYRQHRWRLREVPVLIN